MINNNNNLNLNSTFWKFLRIKFRLQFYAFAKYICDTQNADFRVFLLMATTPWNSHFFTALITNDHCVKLLKHFSQRVYYGAALTC